MKKILLVTTVVVMACAAQVVAHADEGASPASVLDKVPSAGAPIVDITKGVGEPAASSDVQAIIEHLTRVDANSKAVNGVQSTHKVDPSAVRELTADAEGGSVSAVESSGDTCIASRSSVTSGAQVSCSPQFSSAGITWATASTPKSFFATGLVGAGVTSVDAVTADGQHVPASIHNNAFIVRGSGAISSFAVGQGGSESLISIQ